jgi:arylsulfatase A-like enzyme
MAKDGMRFTDYYSEASCTAGRANFITGELPLRSGMTTVGQAGSAIGFPDAAPTIANALHAQGYATGQFGKNHLGDRNPMLPTAHGFDEYFGYLYHLNAMEDPFWYTYPPDWIANVGPRNLVHSWATDVDDGGTTPFAGSKGMVMDGGYRVPAIVKWPGHVPAGTVSSGLISGLDWFPTLTSIAGNPDTANPVAHRPSSPTRCRYTASMSRLLDALDGCRERRVRKIRPAHNEASPMIRKHQSDELITLGAFPPAILSSRLYGGLDLA